MSKPFKTGDRVRRVNVEGKVRVGTVAYRFTPPGERGAYIMVVYYSGTGRVLGRDDGCESQFELVEEKN